MARSSTRRSRGRAHRHRPGQARVLHRPVQRPAVHDDGWHGNTAIEVGNSEGGVVDVMSEWMNEIIFRDILVHFAPASRLAVRRPPDLARPVPARSTSLAAIGAGSRPGPLDGPRSRRRPSIVQEGDEEGPAQDPLRKRREPVPRQARAAGADQRQGGMVALKITIKLGGNATIYTRYVLANRRLRSRTFRFRRRPRRSR